MSAGDSDLRVAVVGYGSIGRRHVDNLLRLGAQRVTIVRRRWERNTAFTPPTGTTIVASIEEALARGVDLALICNPTSLHLDAAAPFVAAGAPTLIEKPLAASLRQMQAAQSWLGATSSNVGVAYCLRYHPAYRIAHEFVASGRLGAPRSVSAWFESYLPDWHPWEDYRTSYAARRELGGGVLPTLDHELDFLQWCFGKPVDVDGVCRRSGLLDMDADDIAHLQLRFSGDIRSEVRLSLCSRERSRGFEFIGANGSLRFDWASQCLTFHPAPCAAGWGSEQVLWHAPQWDVNEMYVDLLRDVLVAVASGRELPTGWEAGQESLRTFSRLAHRSNPRHTSVAAGESSPQAGVFA